MPIGETVVRYSGDPPRYRDAGDDRTVSASGAGRLTTSQPRCGKMADRMERDAAQVFRAIHHEQGRHAPVRAGRDAVPTRPRPAPAVIRFAASGARDDRPQPFQSRRARQPQNHRQYAQAHGYRHAIVDASAMQALPLRPLHRYESLLHVLRGAQPGSSLLLPAKMRQSSKPVALDRLMHGRDMLLVDGFAPRCRRSTCRSGAIRRPCGRS